MLKNSFGKANYYYTEATEMQVVSAEGSTAGFESSESLRIGTRDYREVSNYNFTHVQNHCLENQF